LFRNDHNIVDWLSIVKTKSKSRVQVVEDDKDEVIGGDDVFQMDKLVDPYQVALFTELENPYFCVIKNTFIDIDVDELNIILSTGRHRENNNDDKIDIEFNKEDDVGHDDEENEEEDSN